MAIALLVVGILVATVGFAILLGVAHEEDSTWLWISAMAPPAILIFALVHLERCVFGLAMLLAGGAIAGVGGLLYGLA